MNLLRKIPNIKCIACSFSKIGDNEFVSLDVLDLNGRQRDVELRFIWESIEFDEVRVHGQTRMLAETEIN